MLKESKPVSNDSDLEDILGALKEEVVRINSVQDVLMVAMNKTLITVGLMLLKKQARLLASIDADFDDNARVLHHAHKFQEPLELKSVTSRMILSEIAAKFQHHVSYACRVRKYGTLIYRPSTDLVSLLSEALWKLNQKENNVQTATC